MAGDVLYKFTILLYVVWTPIIGLSCKKMKEVLCRLSESRISLYRRIDYFWMLKVMEEPCSNLAKVVRCKITARVHGTKRVRCSLIAVFIHFKQKKIMIDNMFNIELDAYLKEISDTPTLSGFEHIGQEVFARYARKYLSELHYDSLGNLIGRIPHPGRPSLMLIAHIDQIGFIIKHIDDKGMLYVVPVGGVDTMLLAGQRVCIHHGEKSYLGVFARKPIHLLTEQERRGYTFEELWLDVGFSSRSHAEKFVAIGDSVTFSSDLCPLSDDLVVSSAADNKVGGLILLGALQQLRNENIRQDIYVVSSVQEEIGLRGSMPVASAIKPDMALIIDATHATDYPSINNRVCGNTMLQGGPVLCISPDTNRAFVEKLHMTADKHEIVCQTEVHPHATGTEARAVQLVREGIVTATVSYPVRYMHSPSELFSIADVQNCIDLIVALCKA